LLERKKSTESENGQGWKALTSTRGQTVRPSHVKRQFQGLINSEDGHSCRRKGISDDWVRETHIIG